MVSLTSHRETRQRLVDERLRIEGEIQDYERASVRAFYATGKGDPEAKACRKRLLIELELVKADLAATHPVSFVPLLQTARSFRIAIDALPVGRDIRNRLLAHVDAHIAAIEALAGPC